MHKEYLHEFNRFMEELLDNGVVTIAWARIYRWYGMARLSKNAHKDLYVSILDKADASELPIKARDNGQFITFIIDDTKFKDFEAEYCL